MSLGDFLSKWIFFFVPSLLSYFQLYPCCFVCVNCSFQKTCNISLPNLGLPNFAPRFLMLDEHISNSIKACFVYLLSSHKLGSKVGSKNFSPQGSLFLVFRCSKAKTVFPWGFSFFFFLGVLKTLTKPNLKWESNRLNYGIIYIH